MRAFLVKIKKQKITFLLLLLIIILAAYLRLSGFNWALPRQPYYRAGYQDEAFVINMLLTINPRDYNPHYFINPTFHYYTLLLAIKSAYALGYIKNFAHPVLTNLQGQPIEKITLNDYQRIYTICRIVVSIEGILTALLVYLIGQALYNTQIGLIAGFIFAILPTHVFQSHLFVVDAPAVFWEMVGVYYLARMLNKKKIFQSNFIISGILLGLALGTKYMNILLIFTFIAIILIKERKIIWKNLILTFSLMLIVFLLTTPHALLSWREFLFGNVDEFGGIFGKKGLLAYNNYPTNPFKPFAYMIYYSLRLPLALLAFVALGYVILRRNNSDKIILSFLVPFYLIMTISPSPHLRHSLPALPFLALAIATTLIGLAQEIKNRYLQYIFAGYSAGALIYTFLFTEAMVDRMRYPDTRLEAADWFFKNIPAQTSVGAATVLPFRYTPPIELPSNEGNAVGKTDDEAIKQLYYKLIKTNYDYYSLLHHKPEYFVITQVECEEMPYNQVGEVNARNFIRTLFKEEHYSLVKVFERKYNILGFKFDPDFPNLDWNPVSQKIYIFRKKFE
ncbi:MAG: glycosyltransferase family 39 protein [candidate division WOR-3 bacterium]